MPIPPDDQKFENALKIFETQVGEATQFWFAASAMNEIAIANPDTVTALNVTPSFWITARVGMENQAILSVGKIFRPRKTNPHNIDSLFDVLRGAISTVFSRESLAGRKRRLSSNADEWLPQFMEQIHAPQDINGLHALSKPHRKTYETQWEQIRNEHVAHTGLVDPTARWDAFQKTRISDLEELIGFLNLFYDALWRMYYNGRRPTIQPLSECSVKALVAKKLDELNQNRNQEHIVAETRKCLALFTEAAVPRGAKSSVH
jgi:hypothetical protein